jgi:hypothetical protein
MKKQLLQTKVDEAEQQLALAEEALGAAIGELRGVARAEKTVSSGAIESAFDNLRKSRVKLQDLKTLLDADESA